MSEKRMWFTVLGVGLLAGAACGGLIYNEYGNIDTARVEVEDLRTNIASSRQLLTGTSQLEREVIVLRETEEAIKEVLPDEQDVNNFVRDLQRFEEDSEVSITSLKKKPPQVAGRNAKKADFDKVAYQLTFEADAFQTLAFMSRIENHSRFMAIPSFKLMAASRRSVEETGVPAHKVQLDVETYVYEPQTEGKQVKIDGYARKRELLLGEVARRRQALTVAEYVYRGRRGRRDPWVDPRMPVVDDGGTVLTVSEQITIVDELASRAREVMGAWEETKNAANVIQEMTLRTELEQKISALESDFRRIQDEGSIQYPMAERRLTLEVEDAINVVRAEMNEGSEQVGPTVAELTHMIDTMEDHLLKGEHEMAISAFNAVEPSLDLAVDDPSRRELVETVRQRAKEAQILSDFSNMEIDINGVAIMEDKPPVALINGKALGEGDLVNEELIIRSIRRGEIEFIFRGVILIRRY